MDSSPFPSRRTLLVTLGLVAIAGGVLADPPYQLRRSVLASGGGTVVGTTYRIAGTTGQAASGPVEGNVYRAHTGYQNSGGDLATAVGPDLPGVPLHYELEQNHPNPFNPVTTIAFSLPEAGPTRLTLHDVRGRRVRTLLEAELSAGRHELTLRADDLASGVYWYSLQSGAFTQTRRLVLVK